MNYKNKTSIFAYKTITLQKFYFSKDIIFTLTTSVYPICICYFFILNEWTKRKEIKNQMVVYSFLLLTIPYIQR